ncbi:MAG: 50S ribosomal protein L5 [Candidatus Pacebacteria bacterium]|nr:50S ribosomal protein L5 [Candidatus Paceibacterota bacterium]MDD3919080.1 50S ribosomal protein L5 [Candidatus Paceibacterota bacterium]
MIIKEKYQNQAKSEMMKKFSYKNVMAVPKIEKVVINTGFGKIIIPKTNDEKKKFEQYILAQIAEFAGQKPVLTEAKKSISSFKTREGNVIGAKVTLRGKKMYNFLDKLINIVLPRTRDFKGIKLSALDTNGNLNIGMKEHIAFPEISPEKANYLFGLQITVVSSAQTREEAQELFTLLDFPFKKS